MLEKDTILAVKIRKNKQVDEALKELKKREPTSDSPFFRLAIIGYEIQKAFGSLEHAIVYYCPICMQYQYPKNEEAKS